MIIFSKLWGRIHEVGKMTKAEMKKAQSQMMPLIALQILITFVTTAVLAKLLNLLTDKSLLYIVISLWLGFVVPTQIAAVMFGGTKPKWMLIKSVIMAGGSLACLIIGGVILDTMK